MENNYKIIFNPKDSIREALITFELTGDSPFVGTVIQIIDITMKEKDNPNSSDSITYNVVYVPEGKYQNLEDSMKQTFEAEIERVVNLILHDAVTAAKELQDTKDNDKLTE